MALIAQHQQTSFSNPQNGQSPIDATVVRTNDNALVAKHNSHDADATVHVQTGLLSARPAAGTAGAMYMDENARLYRDDGASWGEVPYARLAAASNTFTGNLAVEGALAVDGTTSLNDDTSVTGDFDVSGTITAGTWSGIPQSAVTNLTSDLAGKAAASHTHAASDITSGTLDNARLNSNLGTRTVSNATAAVTAESVSISLGSQGFFPDAGAPAIIKTIGTAAHVDTSAPTGGIQRWLIISIDGVEYSVLATRTAP
jgi:hypothetical protein